MKQPARIDTRTSLEKLSGLLDAGRQQFGGLLGAIPVVGQMEAIDRGIRAAGQGNMTGVAEAAADIIPAGRLATRGIKALTKGKSTGLLGDVMNIEKPKYQGAHSAPDKDYGAPLNDISRDMYPADVYSAKGLQYYGSNSPGERESLDIARKVRGNPDAMVTVYRAVPKGLQTDINAGDWITPSKEYAKYHADNVIKGQQGQDYEILSKKVPAKHVYTDANSLAEYGYDPTGLGIQGGLLGSGTDSTQMNRALDEKGIRVRQQDNEKIYERDGVRIGVWENSPWSPRPMSITDFVVDENMRGKGVGKKMLDDVLANYDLNQVSAAASSAPSAALFYKKGLRPASNPNATLEETLRQMKEDSSVTMVMPALRNEADLLALQGSQSAINLPNFERLLGLLEDSQ